MGMFDSFYDVAGVEWQTKAFDCDLLVWHVGDPLSADGPVAFQVEVIGDGHRNSEGRYVTQDSFVTVRDGVVEAVNVARDPTLALVGYSGGLLEPPARSRP